MLGLANIQKYMNKIIARENKKYILKKLEQYYEVIYQTDIKEISAKERAIFAFWQAKKQGRLDNLNRLVKITRRQK